MEDMFRYPLDNAEAINGRSAIIRFFCDTQIPFPYPPHLLDTAEHYLSNRDTRTRLSAEDNTLERKFKNAIGADNEYALLHKGVAALIEIINLSKSLVREMENRSDAEAFRKDMENFRSLLRLKDFAPADNAGKRLSYDKTAGYDRLFRYDEYASVRRLLDIIYRMDVYISTATIAAERGFVFARAVEEEDNRLDIRGLYHPALENPTANDVHVDSRNTIIFLTGANMAGKSTFMKSFGIAVFLAHMGFPVPASAMEFTVLDGIYTTINLPDNINMGYSHFYAEVLRVKKVAGEVAGEVAGGKKFFVIFDELFRGTNVKDAYDATVAITEAFSACKRSIFVISTHIIEAGETLGERCPGMRLLYLPTGMCGSKPVYTYRLTEGITADRHGMLIIRNEGILDILEA